MKAQDLEPSVVKLILNTAVSRARDLDSNRAQARFNPDLDQYLRIKYPREIAAIVADCDWELSRRGTSALINSVRQRLRRVQDTEDLQAILRTLDR